MLKVNCEACGAPYEVDPRRVPVTGLKMRCPGCGASVHVAPPNHDADDLSQTGEVAFSGLDLDLPAPKPQASTQSKHKGTQMGLGAFGAAAATVKSTASPGAAASFGMLDDIADLRSPKITDLDDTVDLPAPKATDARTTQKLAPAFPLPPAVAAARAVGRAPVSNDLDLPAPKSQTARSTHEGPLPDDFSDLRSPKITDLDDTVDLPAVRPAAAKGTQKIAPSFDRAGHGVAPITHSLDLPAPKGFTDLPAAKGLTDLPAERGLTDLPAAKGLTDLPAAKGLTDLPAAKGLTDLPAPRGLAGLPAPGGFDIDLPAPHPGSAAATAASHALAQPGAKPSRGGLFDSLALDPGPARAQVPTALTDLDDLPAPGNLPAPKGKKNATALGLGMKGPKDPGHLPGAPAHAFDDLPAPADLPKAKGGQAGLGDLDLPAPGDLPVVKTGLGAEMGANHLDGDSLHITREQAVPQRGPLAHKPAGTALGIGQMMIDASLELPPAAPANQTNSFGLDMMEDLDLPSGGGGATGGASPFGSSVDLDRPLDAAFGGGPGGFPSAKNTLAKGTFGDLESGLDLPPASDSGLLNLGHLALPSPEGLAKGGGTLGSTMDLSADDLAIPQLEGSGNAMGASRAGFPLPTMGEIDLFGESGGGAAAGGKAPRGQTVELDDMFELGGSLAMETPHAPKRAQGGVAKSTFGELDFGLNPGGAAPAPMPMPVPVPATGGMGFDTTSVEAELLGSEAAISAPKSKKKKKRSSKAIPAWVWPIIVLLVISGTGVGLGLFTEHGYFGVYLLEQLLPAAGDPVRVGAAIEQAEKQSKSDTYIDTRKSLVTLSDARNEAGLNRELLARSLLHEALYQLRFGEDAQSSQRSVAILARVMERGGDVPGLLLARAADAARRGELSQAKDLLAQAPEDGDPYRDLVGGEIAMLDKKYKAAEQAFGRAAKKGAGARGHWGLARAYVALEKTAEAEAATKATLEASPRHAAALTYMAQLALDRNQPEAAIEFTRKATGSVRIDGVASRPSRADTTRAWALMGHIEERLEHPREAQAAYERALKADPLRVDVLIGSGRMLMRLGRPRDALSRFDSAISAKPASKEGPDGRIPLVEATTGSAQALLASERPQEALQRLDTLTSQFPKNHDVNLWRGHALAALEKHDEAETAFTSAIESAPNKFAGYVALSQLLFKRDRPEEAARVLNDATTKVQDGAEVRRMLGNSELMRHHLPEAIHQFELALAFDPKDAGALHGLIVAHRKRGDIAQAERMLDRLQKADSSFPGLPLERGQLLENRGMYEEAITVYRKALDERPHDTDLRLRLGAALVTAGRIDEADALLKQVLKERPTSAEAEHFVGRILFARRDRAQAVQRFERAVSFDPLRAEYHLYLAWALLDQSNLSGALESINKAIERDPTLGDAHWILGRIQLRTGAVKDALESFHTARRLKPGRIETLAYMGDAYDELRELSAAVAAYKEATRALPENAEWWYRLGSLHLDRGAPDEARVALQEAVLRGDRLMEKPRWLADAHRLYADLLRKTDRNTEALDHYKLFLTLAPTDHPDRPEISAIVKSSSP